jgi:hypothetical protein
MCCLVSIELNKVIYLEAQDQCFCDGQARTTDDEARSSPLGFIRDASTSDGGGLELRLNPLASSVCSGCMRSYRHEASVDGNSRLKCPAVVVLPLSEGMRETLQRLSCSLQTLSRLQYHTSDTRMAIPVQYLLTFDSKMSSVNILAYEWK